VQLGGKKGRFEAGSLFIKTFDVTRMITIILFLSMPVSYGNDFLIETVEKDTRKLSSPYICFIFAFSQLRQIKKLKMPQGLSELTKYLHRRFLNHKRKHERPFT
jgi:hypothetical protein